MKKIRALTLIIILSLIISLWAPCALAAPTEPSPSATPTPAETNADGLTVPKMTATYVVLADLDTGKMLYERNEDAKAYPASLTKIMTALLAVEAVENGTVALTDKVAAFDDCRFDLTDDSSTSDIVPGEVLTFEDLLYCALLASANEACNIIGEYLAGSVSDFVVMMNQRAKELGCTGTNFVNTHGLPDENHYTTAHDMYLLSKEAVSHELFMSVCNSNSYTVPANNVSEARTLYNSNALISGKGVYGGGYIYDYAAGVKTGHTSAAGYCLVSTAEKNGVHVMAVVMGCSSNQREDGSTSFGNFNDSINLYKWVFENYQYLTVYSTQDLLAEAKIKYAPADAETVTLRPESDVSLLVPSTIDPEGFEKNITLYEASLVAPISAGQALGEMEISQGGVSYGTVKLVATSSVDMSQSQFMKEKISNTFSSVWVQIVFWLVILVILIYVALVIRYRIRKQRYLREKRQRELERQKAREKEAADKIFAKNGSPRMEYFDPGDKSKPGARRPATPVSDLNKTNGQRDYFDEFFRRENENNDKK